MDFDRTLKFIHEQLDEIEQWFSINLAETNDNVHAFYVLLGRLSAYNELLDELEQQLLDHALADS